MKQKLAAWQEEVEKLTPVQERVNQLEIELAQMQGNNEMLHRRIEQLENDIERNKQELSEKISDYNILMKRFTELQETRVNLENELQPLREERATILRENAHLLEGSDPKKYASLKKEFEALQTHCEELEFSLHEQGSLLSAHQESNVEMQQQLDKATDPERLQSIRSRMERYKQERDVARSRVEEVEKLVNQLQEASDQFEERILELQQQMSQQEKSLGKSADYESRMRRYREERNMAVNDNRALKLQVKTLEGAISDLIAQTGHQDTSDFLQTLTGDFESMNVAGMEHSLEHKPQHEDFQPASPHENDYQPQNYSTDEDQHNYNYSPQGEVDSYHIPTEQEPVFQHGAGRAKGDKSQSSESQGSLEISKPKAKGHTETGTVEVRTKEGIVHVKVQKPQIPLSAKDKPNVIVKRGVDDFEAGTLRYIGNHGGKEVAGVEMQLRQLSEFKMFVLVLL